MWTLVVRMLFAIVVISFFLFAQEIEAVVEVSSTYKYHDLISVRVYISVCKHLALKILSKAIVGQEIPIVT